MYKQLAVALTAVVALAACQKKADAPAPAPAAEPAAVAAPAAAPAEPAPAAPVASTGFGVPACDDYLTKYLACVDSKVPAEMREQGRASIEATRTAWQQAAATEAGKAGLAAGCAQATEAAKAATAAWGCAW